MQDLEAKNEIKAESNKSLESVILDVEDKEFKRKRYAEQQRLIDQIQIQEAAEEFKAFEQVQIN